MAEQGGLNVELGITLDRLTKQLASAEQRMIKAAKRSESEFQRRNRGAADSFKQIDVAAARTAGLMGRLGGTIAGAFAGGLAFGAITQGLSAVSRAVGTTITELGDLADTASRIGVGTEELQGLRRGFQLAGVEVGELDKGLEQFARRLGDAAQGGAFNDVLDRFNIQLRNSQGEIKPTLDLLKEFADAIRSLPETQQLAVAQEAFGRSGLGFVNALREGGDGLTKFIDEARKAGTIIDDELVQKAEEIGDRFDALGLRIKVFFQERIIELVNYVDNLTQAKLQLDEIASNSAQLGNIDPNADISGARVELEDYSVALEGVQAEAQGLAIDLQEAAAQIRIVNGEADGSPISNLGLAFAALAVELENANAKFEAGTITGDEYRAELVRIESQAAETLSTIDGIDTLGFENVIARLGSLGGALSGLVGLARAAAAAVASVGASTVPDAPGPDAARRQRIEIDGANRKQKAANDAFIGDLTRVNGLTREQVALESEVARIKSDAAEAGAVLTEQQISLLAQEKLAAEAARAAAGGKGGSGGGKGGGGGGGGGKPQRDEVAELLKQGEEKIAQLELEASMLGKTAEEVLFLKTQYELLQAAKEKGLALDTAATAGGATLREEINAQAAAVAQLATAYDMAREKAEFFEDITEQLKDGIVDSIVAGEGFKGVLADIATALAKAAVQAALFGTGPLASLFGGNMVGQGLFSFLPGFDSGGYTGDGGRLQPKGVVHGGEYVFDKASVKRIGLGNLQSMHRQLKGYSEGGLVGGSPSTMTAAAPSVEVVVIDNEEKFGDYLSSNPRAERAIMAVVKRNGG